MAKSFKYKNDNYLDSSGIVHQQRLLSDILPSSITLGEEFKTGRIVGGKTEYGIIRKKLGTLPASSVATNYSIGIDDVTYTEQPRIYAVYNNLEFPLPFVGASQAASITAYRSGNIITVQPYTDRSSFTLYVDVYYIKN